MGETNSWLSGGGIGNTEDTTTDLLPRSIFVPREDTRKELRETVDSIFSDKFMAFLSIILIPIILLPFFFDLPSSVSSFFDICDATVIVFFVVEYSTKLYLASSRWEYFKAPWHLLDLSVVLLSFASYLPLLRFGSTGSASLLLRLLRLPRALAVGGRAAGSRIRTTTPPPTVVVSPVTTFIRQVDADLKTEHDNLSWKDVEEHLRTSDPEWIDIYNITAQAVLELASLLRVPSHHFKVSRVDEVYPHIDYLQEMSFLFLQSGEIRYPARQEGYFTVARRGEIIICVGPKVISASPHGVDLFQRTLSEVRRYADKRNFRTAVLYGIMDATLREYRSIISEIEIEVTRIGSVPRSRLPGDFLQRMYELNKEVTRLVSNMAHFRELIGVMISKRIPLDESEETEEEFKRLQDETSYLNDISEDILDHLHTITDLYINQSSFETNRILKILAVITSLAIIPSAIAGILGMNLLDVPYTFELWQVAVIITFAMAFVGYCFFKLGWLKS